MDPGPNGKKAGPQGPNPNGKQGNSLVDRSEVRWTLRVLNT